MSKVFSEVFATYSFFRSLIICLVLALPLLSCSGGGDSQSQNNAPNEAKYISASWVIIGTDSIGGNQAIARVATSYVSPTGEAVCPNITIDGFISQMTMRVVAGLMPLRSTDYQPSVAANFPVSVCETVLPLTAKVASIAGQSIPLPKKSPDRVLLFGDTGCRMDTTTLQNCDDPSSWPFSNLAKIGAQLAPDLVIHMGDYQYREVPCSSSGGCPTDVNSPWGYGWDTWQADFFTPAAPLLEKAPFVLVRGDHEICTRGGQGWFRFLDPNSYTQLRSCNNASNDTIANYSSTYAVDLGRGSRLVVYDSSDVSTGSTISDPNNNYYQQFMQAFSLASNPIYTNTIFINHHPILAYNIPKSKSVPPGNVTLQGVMNSVMGYLYPSAAVNSYYPSSISMAFHAHVHSMQAINFSNTGTSYPATIVSGGGGNELADAFPTTSPPFYTKDTVAPGLNPSNMIWNNNFGFALLERIGESAFWKYTLYDKTGNVFAVCTQSGRQLNCSN
jgi:hypothetical protein